MKIILITGTKGKTSLSLTLNNILLALGNQVLCISSEGIIKNGKTIKNNEYFLKKYETSANVCALKEISAQEASRFDYVILESSYSSGKNLIDSFAGNKADLAILTNVYWDHIDGKKIADQGDLLEKKLGIIANLKKNGTAIIYTGDKKNSISCAAISKLSKRRKDINIVSYNKKLFPKIGDKINKCYLKSGFICFNNNPLIELASIKSPFGAHSEIFKLNMLALSGILNSLKIKPEILKKDDLLSIPGRFNLFAKKDCSVILDYAHEIKSLTMASETLRSIFKNKRIIAIIRLSYYRKESTIRSLTREIAPLFDSFVIYDKAISRPSLRKIFTYDKPAGSVAKMMLEELKKKKVSAKIINDELEAIKKSIHNLKNKEVLYIIGDQIQKDISTIKKELEKK